jgi:rRNA maturation protein Rpf1
LVINPITEFDFVRHLSFTLGGSYYVRRTHYSYYDDVKANTFEIKLGLTVHL